MGAHRRAHRRQVLRHHRRGRDLDRDRAAGVIVNRDGSLNLASVVRHEGDAPATSVTTPQDTGNAVAAGLYPQSRR